jgi:hypothetical protein
MDPQKMELYYEELRRMKELKKKDYKRIFRNGEGDNKVERVLNRHQIQRELYKINMNQKKIDFDEYHSFIQKEVNEKEDIDICILGGGPTGTYLARRMAYEYPSKKILLVEKGESVGGHIYSSSFEPLKSFYTEYNIEFGNGKVIEKDIKMKHLCEILGIEKEKERERRLYQYYLRNKLNGIERFEMGEEEKSYELKEKVDEYIKKNYGIYSFFEESTRFKIETEDEFMKISFEDELLSSLSDEGKDFHLGKNGLYEIKNQSLYTWIYDLSIKNEKRIEFKISGEGICEKLVEKYHRLTFEQMKNSRFRFELYPTRNHYLLLQTRCESFIVNNPNNIEISLLYQDGFQSNRTKIRSKELYITYPVDDLINIYRWDIYYTKMIKESIESRPIFEFYIYFEDTSNIPEWGIYTDAKIHRFERYMGNVYYGVSYKEIWDDKIDKRVEKEMKEDERLINIIWEEMKKYYQRDDIPKGKKISWRYEKGGVKRWNRIYKNRLEEIKKKIRYPFTDKVNVYYVNEDVSLLQDHWEGAIEEVESFFGESSILDMSLL